MGEDLPDEEAAEQEKQRKLEFEKRAREEMDFPDEVRDDGGKRLKILGFGQDERDGFCTN